MSKTIDSRIVEMQFNNKQFEQNVSTSMSTLDKLKRSLNMDGATKGLENVNDAAKNVNMSGLSGAVENVRLKFSALEVMAVTALVNITNSAINAGKRIVSSLTLDPIKDGFKEYEMVLGAIQTTMAGTGKTMEEVEQQLKRLDDYADETVYSTSDMLSNLPKFTNAGVELETAATAMIGIANATALAGGDARSASSAFYNLGQSIGTGYLTRMDYNSINNAGIATMEWKNQMIDAAIAQGQLVKVGEDAYEANGKLFTLQSLFIDGLQQQWASSDVLIKVFEDYGDVTTDIGKKAQSSAQDLKTFTMMMESLQAAAGTGWKDTWQLLFGDLEEAKVLWTGLGNAIGDMISKSAKARNDMLQGWHDLGGRTSLIEAFKNAFAGVSSVVTPIKEAFRDIFPPTTSEQLLNLTNGLKEFTSKLKISDETADKLRRTFSGVFALLDIAKEFFGAIFRGVGDVLGLMSPLGDGLLDATARFGDFLVGIRDTVKETGFFTVAVDGIVTILTDLRDFLVRIADGIKEAITNIGEHFRGFGSIDIGPLDIFSKAVEIALHPFTAIANLFKWAWEKIVAVIEWVRPYVEKAAKAIGPALETLFGAFGEAFRSGDLKSFMELVNTGLLGTVIVGIKKFIDSLKDVGENASGMLEGITSVLDGVRGCLEAYQTKLKAQALLTIAIAVGVLAASLWVLSGIPADKMLPAISALTTLVAELAATMVIMGKAFKQFKGGTQILLFAVAILILANALKSLAELNPDQLQIGLTGVTALIIELTAAAMVMSKSSSKMIKGGVGLIAMATAILILAQAVKSLNTLDPGQLATGLIGVGVLLAEIAGFTQIVKPEKLISTGLGMIAMATALNIMSGAVTTLSSIDPLNLTQGLIALGVILAEIAGFTQIVNPEKLISVGVAMTAMGAALKIISSAVKTFGEMDLAQLAQGLIAMGVALAEIAGFTQIVKPEKMLSTGVALIAVGTALLLIAKAIQSFGGMSLKTMAKGLIMLGGSLLIITVALNAMKGAIGGAAAMLVFAAALNLMIPAMLVFGKMGWDEIGKALLMLAGIFVVFGASAAILSPLIPVMIGLAAAVALLGAGVLALGVGMVALSAGLTAFTLGGPAFITGLTLMLEAIIMMIPAAMAAVVEGLILMIKTLADGIGVVIESLVVILKAVIEGLIVLIPDVVEAVFLFLTAMADALIEFIPKLIELGLTLLLSLLHGIADNIQEVTATVLQIVEEFLRGLAEGIPGVVAAAIEFVSEFIMALGQEIPNLVDAGFQMIIDLCNGLADAISENSFELGEAAVNLATAIIEGLIEGLAGGVAAVVEAIVDVGKALWNGFKDFFDIHSPSKKMEGESGNIISGIIKGLTGGIEKLVDKAKEIGGEIFDGIKGAVSNVGDIASNVVGTLGDGLKNGLSTVGDAAKDVGSSILGGIKGILGINSPARTMIEAAHYTGQGLIVGLKSMMRPVANADDDMGGGVIDAMRDSLSKVSDVLDSDMDMTPTIRPVIDMSDVENGLNSTFSKQQHLNMVNGVTGSVTLANQTANSMNRRPNVNHEDSRDSAIDNLNKSVKELTSNQSKTFENTFNISGNNPKEIAEEVSRIIQRQVERRDASWA